MPAERNNESQLSALASTCVVGFGVIVGVVVVFGDKGVGFVALVDFVRFAAGGVPRDDAAEDNG